MQTTVYDLLTMVKNGEKLPKKVIFQDIIFENIGGDLVNDMDCSLFEHRHCGHEKLLSMINDEVYILEENEMPEKITINENGTIGFPDGQWKARNMDKAFAMKINEIIDYINSKKED